MRLLPLLVLALVTVPAHAGDDQPPAGPEVVVGRGDPTPYVHCRFVPAAARTLRRDERSRNWATDLDLLNPGQDPVQVSVALLKRDADNRTTEVAALADPLAPGATVHLPDVVQRLLPYLWRPWHGGLVVCADLPGLLVGSRSYLLGPGETTTVGQGIPGLAVAEAVQPGTIGHIFGLREDDRFRSHLGLLNPSPFAVDVTIRLRDDDGATRIVLVHDLQPYSQVQYDRILARFGGGVATGRAEVTCPGGPVFAYATLVDNSSDDPSYLPCRVSGE